MTNKIKISTGEVSFLDDDSYLGTLDQIGDASELEFPEYLVNGKIKMTPKETDEFNKLKGTHDSLILALDEINTRSYPELTNKLMYNNSTQKDNKALLDFVRAWLDPDLIMVGPKEKYYTIRVPHTKDIFYYKENDGNLRCGTEGNDLCFKFTKDELVEYNLDLPLFKKKEVEE